MTEGSMTGRPYGGTNDRSGQDDDVLPGERPVHDDEDAEVGAAPDQSPRAGEGGMGTGDRPGFPGS
ncbi:hypothetical protein [Geodermatophilus sp. SYSU D00710]